MVKLTKTKRLFELTIQPIREGILNREFSVRELAEEFIARIQSLESRIKAWAYFEPDILLRQAEAQDKRLKAEEPLGKLFGVPIGIKDIFNTKDMPTAMGSPLRKYFTPGNDARVVFNIRQEDGLIAGKTHTAEFAVHEPGETRNPHNIDYYPGTSSSGSATAVASGMVPVATGTQTAGSIIRPASYCGIYGFKPSFGTIPRTGVLKTTDTLDQIGWFSRTIEDLQSLFDVIRVKGLNHPYVNATIDKYKDAPKKIWRVGIIEHPKWDYADDYAKGTFLDFVSRLSKNKNFILEKVDLSPEFEKAHDVHNTIYCKALSYYFQEECKYVKFVSKVLMEMINKSQSLRVDDYKKALAFQGGLASKLDRYFDRYDVLMTLSTSGEAPKFERPYDKPDSCLIWTMCWVPVINLPVFKGPNNMPYGVQIVGRRYHDPLLFAFAKTLKNHRIICNVEPVGG